MMEFLLWLFSYTAILPSLTHFFSQISTGVYTCLSHLPLIVLLGKINLVTPAITQFSILRTDALCTCAFCIFQFLLEIQSIPGGIQRPASPDVLLT